MKNAFSRLGRTCASLLFGGALIATSLLAAPNTITLSLPHAVTVGSTTLPAGQYTMSPVEMNDGNQYFVVRGDKTPTVTLMSQRVDTGETNKTQVTLSKDGDTWHFDKLLVEGDTIGYEFTK
jgi:hypothetical protein